MNALLLQACSAKQADVQLSGTDASIRAEDAAVSVTISDGSLPMDATEANPDVDAPPPPSVTLAPALETALACNNDILPFDFIATPSDFNVDHAFWMMWFAERTFYCDQPEIRAELAAIGFNRFVHLEEPRTGVQLYVAGSDETVVVAFRGSTEVNDWLGDFNFPEDEGSAHGVEGRVHRGFAQALSSIYPRIVANVKSLSRAGQTVWVTGHSLGGAEATLLAARLAGEGFNVGPLYTYGAPRAGDGGFAVDAHDKLHARVYRIVNERDLVAHLPPAAVAAEEAANAVGVLANRGAALLRELDYRHAGQMAWLPYSEGTDLMMQPVLSDADDQPYWKETAKGGTLGTILNNRQQGQRHAPQRYLCRMLALRRALRSM